MTESENDFLAGLLEFASRPESNSNSSGSSPKPLPKDSAFRCGFCLAVKYKNQSSLDSHIQKCAQIKGYKANFWREAGWTQSELETGFIFQDDCPIVNPNRICRYCLKTFANATEVIKHVNAARCINAQAIPAASPAVVKGIWRCGFCGKKRCFTSEVSLDSHVKLCGPRHGYIAKFWKDAGWEPDSRFGKGLNFENGTATAKSERICQACYQCCKSLVGLKRHLENGQCSGEPDDMSWNPPPLPTIETITHLASHGAAMPKYHYAGSSQQPQTADYARFEAALKVSAHSKGSARMKRSQADTPPSMNRDGGSRSKGDSVPQIVSKVALPTDSKTERASFGSHATDPGSASRAEKSMLQKSEGKTSEIDFLLKVIHTAPSLAITELLVNIARSDPKSRAVPLAPVRPRQKRPQDVDQAVELASRTKTARHES